MNLEKWLETNIGYEAFRPGLDRVYQALELFDLGLSQKKIISIAGTNGKGQTSREIYRLCQNKHSCALWTSPHLICLEERFSKNGELVHRSELEQLCLDTYKHLNAAQLKLSYFEFLFLVFLRFSSDCEVLVLEVGLGGRLDAVNVVDADIAVVSSISRDHQDYLGSRYEQILSEKLGIARAQGLTVTNFELSYLRQLSNKFLSKLGSEWVDLFDIKVCTADMDFSKRNLLLANFCASKLLGEDLSAQLGEASPLIEFEIEGAVCHGLTSHNPDGVRKGVQFLNHDKYTNAYQMVLMSFSDRRMDDAQTMLNTVKAWMGEKANIVLCAFDHPKAMPRDRVRDLAQKARVKFVNDATEFIKNNNADKTLVLGSNYFIGQFLQSSRPRR